MTKLHVAVIGTPAEKGADNKYLPIPQENAEFIASVLNKAHPETYGALYHGAASGIDALVDDWAFNNHVRTKQFPAYWFDPTAEKNVNKSAGLSRTEAMLRELQNNTTIYDKESKTTTAKPDVQGVVLIFTSRPVDDVRTTKHAKEKCEKYGLQYRVIELPVQATNASEAPNTSDAIPF